MYFKNNSMNKILLIFLFALLCNSIYSQKKYEGIVVDESGEPLIGAKLVSLKEKRCWITDQDGIYNFVASDSLEIYTNYVGCPQKKYRLSGHDTIILESNNFDKMQIHYFHPCDKYFSLQKVLDQKEFKEYIDCKITNHLIHIYSQPEMNLNYYTTHMTIDTLINYNKEINVIELNDKEINENLIIYSFNQDRFLNLGNTIAIDSLKTNLYELYLLDIGNKEVKDLNRFQIFKNNYPIGMIIKNND